jgi:magnesium and cobalt exporter, CNNM family
MYLFIFSVAFALIVSFFCSLSEATVLSLTPGEVADLTQKHRRTGKIWETFKSALDRPITVILILNTTAHTLGATVAGAQVEKIWHGKGIFLFSLLFTLMILFMTEILPKTLGVEYRKTLSLFIAPPLNFLVNLFRPLISVARFISHPFKKSKRSTAAMPLEELRALAAYARLSNLIGSYQEKIIHEASRLSQKTAGQIMIPADEIIYFNDDKSMEDMIIRAHLDPHTRFPIISENDINKILGYINFKELLFLAKNNPHNPSIAGIIRPVKFISPDTSLTGLLRSFIEEHIHMAIVQDRSGKTLGLITLEDIIEEFLGDIEDEFDRLPKMYHPLAGGAWMVGGGVLWWDLAKQLGKPFESFDGTLSAWLLNRAQKSLKSGDCVTYMGMDFLVRRIRRGKIFEVTILPHGSTPPPHLPKTEGSS